MSRPIRLVPMAKGHNRGLGVSLDPVSPEDADAMLAVFRSIQRVEDARIWAALDAAARFVAIMRYDSRGDPIEALDRLDTALRRLR